MSKFSADIKKILTPGTPLCSLVYAAIGVVIAVLLLTIGPWKTLFIVAFGAVGGLLGGIGNKQEAVREIVNRRFPEKDAPIRDPNLDKSEIAEMTEKIIKNEAPAEPDNTQE